MKEIIALNDWLLKHPADLFLERDVYLDRADSDGDLDKFPSDCQVRIEALWREVEKRIPDDFGYILCLGLSTPDLVVTYGNDWETAQACSRDWDRQQSIFKQLEETDWNWVRQDAIRQSVTPDPARIYATALVDSILEEARRL